MKTDWIIEEKKISALQVAYFLLIGTFKIALWRSSAIWEKIEMQKQHLLKKTQKVNNNIFFNSLWHLIKH